MYSEKYNHDYMKQFLIMFSYLNRNNDAPPECLSIYESVLNAK